MRATEQIRPSSRADGRRLLRCGQTTGVYTSRILFWNFCSACSGGGHREPHGAPLLKAFAAIHGTSLSGFEGDRSLLPALRADCLGFHSLDDARTISVALATDRFTGFAAFWFVLEAFVGEKH